VKWNERCGGGFGGGGGGVAQTAESTHETAAVGTLLEGAEYDAETKYTEEAPGDSGGSASTAAKTSNWGAMSGTQRKNRYRLGGKRC